MSRFDVSETVITWSARRAERAIDSWRQRWRRPEPGGMNAVSASWTVTTNGPRYESGAA